MFWKSIPFVFIFLAIFGVLQVALAHAESPVTCAVCGMEMKPGARASFESIRNEKPVYLYSYSCAHAFHSKYPDAPLFAFDWDTGSKIDVKSASFLVKSKNVLKELEFGMAPTVVAFSSEALAKKHHDRLKDGEVVKGYEALEKIFQ